MVVGEHQRPDDLGVNICKLKHLTNMRAASKDRTTRLTPPRLMSLDESIEYLADDELLEVTPESMRIPSVFSIRVYANGRRNGPNGSRLISAELKLPTDCRSDQTGGWING